MAFIITGIQQAGIGVADAQESKLLYRDLFGMDTLLFDDVEAASLMTRYTGSEVHKRRAILSLNMKGGGGFEIWQFLSRSPQKPGTAPRLGDLGIFAIKIKAPNIVKAHEHFSRFHNVKVSGIMDSPDDRLHFWIRDNHGNWFNIVEGDEWFKTTDSVCGGVVGAVIGVSNMDKALQFYKDFLGINEMVYSGTAPAMDTPEPAQQGEVFKRALLKKPLAARGAFSKLLGSVQVELFEIQSGVPAKIFAGRYWGDVGFIHLCFDVLQMDELKHIARQSGYPFTVDSADSFDMGSYAGRFCYLEDPDGTLIELVETHKVPVLKKLGFYLNLKKRKGDKPLPDWIVGMLALNKIH